MVFIQFPVDNVSQYLGGLVFIKMYAQNEGVNWQKHRILQPKKRVIYNLAS